MRPDQLGEYRAPSDARLHPDGIRAAFVVTQMDLDEDRYIRRIWMWDGDEARPLTSGDMDTTPRWSPDGSRLAFLRKGPGEEGRPQVAILRLDGGEASITSEFELGASDIAWSPDGSTLAVVASEWTEEWKDLDKEKRARTPRRITRMGYRFDSRGWIHDKRSHVWLIDVDGDQDPICLTPGDFNETQIVWSPDGRSIAFVSERHGQRGVDLGNQIWSVPSAGGIALAMTDIGIWSMPSYDRSGNLYALGAADRWAHPGIDPLQRLEPDGSWTQITSIDRNLDTFVPVLSPGGPQWLDNGSALSTLEDSGRVRIVRISPDGEVEDVIGGDRLITGISPRSDGSAAVFTATSATDPGELWWWENGEERRLTTLNDEFRGTTTLAEPQRFVINHDGAEVEGWVYLPEGDGKVPLLLNIHGGPATQYGYGFFDEFQVYAGAGYGVVAINPRGASGYGREFVRAVVGAWHEEMPPDVVDLLAAPDVAAQNFTRLDPDRMGIMGGSYGGFATVRVTAEDQRYKSAIAERGLYVWTSFVGTSDIGTFFDGMYVRQGATRDELWAASPLRHAGGITTPTLVLHSETDWRCPIEQGEQLFALLQNNGVESE
ncbi:MAG: S9 family peptidase, partial [Actinomycetota bacterium]|nr:S9 family peptidase [Actinomycetota bacterium]